MNMVRRLLSPTGIAIIILTLITAFIHISLGQPIFILNGLVYLALLLLYFSPSPKILERRSLVRWEFVGYAAVTIILYFVFNAGDWLNTLGLVTKLVEVALIVLLVMDGRKR